jgi:phosphoribosylformylglycinamidine synthase
VYEQYDTMVRTNTLVGPGMGDAAVVRIKGTKKGLAVKTDCNARYVYLNPRQGGRIAVAEAARNVVCAGGKPLAITNCLNFGNPYKPEVYWVFTEAAAGMGEACTTFNTPVTGGNVSFYNENPDGAVFPTPTIGMLGLVENVDEHVTTIPFKDDGDAIFLLSPADWTHRDDLGGSEYLAFLHGITAGDAPHFDLDEEKAVQEAMLALIHRGVVKSAHDISDGGLAICFAECVMQADGLGADIELETPSLRLDATLFGEAQSRIVFTAEEGADISADGVRITRIGTVTRGTLKLVVNGRRVVDASVESLIEPYNSTIPSYMAR